MNKKIIVFPILIIIGILIVNASFEQESDVTSGVFFILIADPEFYSNGVYTNQYTIEKGEYSFRFVPNGSSPETLSISLNGENFGFSEDFKLVGTSHQTWNSQEYFTWEYVGEKTILISETQEIELMINPNGNVMGSVSIGLEEN